MISFFMYHLTNTFKVNPICPALCMSEKWRVHVLNVHHSFDRAVRYCSLSCSVMPVQALKLAAGGPHPPYLHSHPPTVRSLCLEELGVFPFGQGPLVWSSPSPDEFLSGSGLYWVLRWPAAVLGRGQADLLLAPPHHLETIRCTCREKHYGVTKSLNNCIILLCPWITL